MKYYIELTLSDNNECSLYLLWSKLYAQLHLALVEQQNPDKTVNIGVSFPEYQCVAKDGKIIGTLGSKLRVFARTKSELQQLNLNKWLERLMDYIHIKSIQPVSDNISCHVNVKRYGNHPIFNSSSK